ncbi:MAG: TIGR02206 family membrane protein [Woeseia sp.]|nr:TIGR02206 family membrane protein [Woeseia sp.]|tara:strand:- start:346 stop:1071 length:726 start_codon:yes stop_codon:yes gene_type:complete
MFETQPFQIFSFQHLVTVLIVLSTVITIPFYLRNKSDSVKVIVGKLIAILILVYQVVQVFTNTIIFEKPWVEILPLHMCDLSSLCIAIYFLRGGRIFFNCAFFWGVAGATMSLLTPTVKQGFPGLEYLLFFYFHGLILFGVMFSFIALKKRPYLHDLFKVITISIIGMGVIYSINILLGEEANFWYLQQKPDNDTLMNFFPDPPLHLIPLVPAGIFFMSAVYFPFWLRDRITSSRKAFVAD